MEKHNEEQLINCLEGLQVNIKSIEKQLRLANYIAIFEKHVDCKHLGLDGEIGIKIEKDIHSLIDESLKEETQ